MSNGWGRPFEDPKGRRPQAGDATRCRGVHRRAAEGRARRPEWQAASSGPTVFARIGIMRALNCHYVPEFNPKGEEPHWGRRKLKRDQ